MLDWKVLGGVLAWALAATIVALFFSRSVADPANTPVDISPVQRIISLSPALTETLFAIGAGDTLVARTDYCKFPKEASKIPSIGPGLGPDLEAIARKQPTHILVEQTATLDASQFESIASTTALPWLTLEDLNISLNRLGELTGHEQEALALASELQQAFSVELADDAPSVLLLMGIDADDQALWFVKRQSLHGRALRAAGARNAVAQDVNGAPSMSVERLLQLNPDIIIGMSAEANPSPGQQAAFLARFDKLPTLAASQTDKIAIIAGPEHYSTGPLLLDLIKSLQDAIRQVTEPKTTSQ